LSNKLTPLIRNTIQDQNVILSDEWYYQLYRPDESIGVHMDGHKMIREWKSKYTLLIYLNHEFDQGNTIIYDGDEIINIKPRCGDALILTQDVLHEGQTVLNGTKFVLRGDILFRSIQ